MNVVPRAAQKAQARAEAVQAEIDQQLKAAAEQASTTPLAAPVAPPVAEPEVTPPAPEPPQAQKLDEWEQRYRSLQGVFNSEVPRLQQTVKDQALRLSELEARIAEAAKANEAPKVPPAKDIEDFGADLVNMVVRQAQESVAQAAGQFEARLAKLEQVLAGTTQTVAATTEKAFFDEIARGVPDWETVNSTPAFIAWLQEADPIYGVARQAALTQAQKALNAKQVIAIFQAWKAKQAPVEQARTTSLAQQVAPSASSAAPQPTPSAPEIFAYADVLKFYDDVAKRKYRGREKEAEAIEARINKAMAEGRVR
jgi:hypothetical protein